MTKRKSNKLKIFRSLLFTASIFALVTLFSRCKNDDPIQGWTYFLEPAPPPRIVSLYSVIKNCEPPYPVTFKAVTKDLIGKVSYKWDFGDSTISTDKMPTHIYTRKAVFKVKLTISNQIGSDTLSIYMQDLNKPSLPIISDFSYEHVNNNSFVPNKMIFTNKSSGANQFYWYFGDGDESNNESPEHIFTTPGTYTVKLRGTCSNGTFTEFSQQVFFTAAPQRIFIDSLNLMLPSNLRNNQVYVEFWHNMTIIGGTVSLTPSSYPIKFKRPRDFTGGYFFDFVQYTSNEVFKFVVYRYISDGPPQFLYEILLSSVDIKNNFYPTAYYQIETVPAIKDVFIDLYLSY